MATHYLFDTDYNELDTYVGGNEPVEYATCADHAFHDTPGRWECYYPQR